MELGENIIETAVSELIMKEPFFANLILNMRRIYTNKIPTLGVNVTDEVNLYVNPYFWGSLNIKEQVAILKHECMHVINNHFERFEDLEPDTFNSKKKDLFDRIMDMKNANVMNISADYAINEYLPGLPKEMKFFDDKGNPVVEPDKIKDDKGNEIDNPKAGKPITGKPCLVNDLKGQLPHRKVENLQHTEYYYDLLQEEGKKGNGPAGGGVQVVLVDDHSIWNEGEKDQEIVKEKVKQVVNGAVEKTTEQNGAGSIPGDLMDLIERLNHVPKDWRADLQRFAARTSEIKIESSRKRRNRRYGLLYPGHKIYPELHLAVCTDCSGSVSDEQLNQFFAEINKIKELGAKITIIEFDAKVNNVYEYDPKKPIKVTGRGGTHFQPAFEEASKHEVDGIIFFTDGGDCYNDAKQPKVPLLWALLDGYTCTYEWGQKTYVKVKKKKS